MFAKHWTPGQVKTRLAATIGEAPAAQVARSFIETLTARLAGLADRQTLAYWPPDARQSFVDVVPANWLVQPQCEGDLGARMHHHFENSFAAGAQRVVLLGADSPNVPIAHVQRALEQLAEHRLVLGPTGDGGYYLVGVSRAEGEDSIPPIFDDMPWSSERLWSATTDRLAGSGWNEQQQWAQLPGWYDVDTMDDLNRLLTDLAQTEGDPSLVELRQRLDTILQS